MGDDLLEELEQRTRFEPRRELQHQQKRRFEQTRRAQRLENARKKRDATLLRACINAKPRPKRKRAIRPAKRALTAEEVERDFRARMEHLGLALEDPRADRAEVQALQALQRVMPAWRNFKARELQTASRADQSRVQRVQKKRRDSERASAQREHARAFAPVLRAIDPEHCCAPRATARPPFRSLKSFFRKTDGVFQAKTERRFNAFYFDMMVDRRHPSEEFPLAAVETSESEDEGARPDESSACARCLVPLVANHREGILTCPSCGVIRAGGFGLGYKQSFPEWSASTRTAAPYERLSHFKEFIARLEGSEKTEVPHYIINLVLQYCKSYDINPQLEPDRVTYAFLRNCLQQNDKSNFFKNISQIRSIVCRTEPLRFTEEQKSQLEGIFNRIQAPFSRHQGRRKNFLSYSYTIYKCCELLQYYEFMPYLSLLKAPQNLEAADNLWRKICEDLDDPNFPFIPTVSRRV